MVADGWRLVILFLRCFFSSSFGHSSLSCWAKWLNTFPCDKKSGRGICVRIFFFLWEKKTCKTHYSALDTHGFAIREAGSPKSSVHPEPWKNSSETTLSKKKSLESHLNHWEQIGRVLLKRSNVGTTRSETLYPIAPARVPVSSYSDTTIRGSDDPPEQCVRWCTPRSQQLGRFQSGRRSAKKFSLLQQRQVSKCQEKDVTRSFKRRLVSRRYREGGCRV